MADNLEHFSSADGSEQPSPHEHQPQSATPPAGRSAAVGSDFLIREGAQARAGGATTLSERLRRREAYHADDTARRTPRPRDRAVTTSHKIAEAMTEFVGPDGRTYAAIPMDLYAEVAEEEQEVPEEEYDAEAAFAAWTQLSDEQQIAGIEQAQMALDTLPGNDRAIMERIVLVAANARAGLKTAAQRTRQYFTVGDQIIAQSQQHGATFTTESFEALLFAMDDTLKGRPSITSTQLEECDAVVLGHMAVLTTGGTPIMPDSFADSGNIFRTPVQSVGRFGIMTRDLDSEGNVRLGPWLWRNFRVAWRRYGPLVLLGLGWAWNPIYTRAEILREMMTGTGAPAPVRRLAQRRGLFWTAATAALTLLLLAAFVSLTIFRGDLSRFGDSLGHGVTNPFGGNTTGSLCVDCPTVTAALPTTTDGAAPTATSGSGNNGCGASCGGGVTPTPTRPAGPTQTPKPGAKTITTPSDLRACDGCGGDLSATYVSASGTYGQGSFAADYHAGTAATRGSLWIGIQCNFNQSVGCAINAGTRVTATNGMQCSLDASWFFDTSTGNREVGACTITVTGYHTWNFVGVSVSCSPCFSASVYQQQTISSGTNGTSAYYTMPSACASRGDPTGNARSQVLGRVGAPASAPDTLGAPQASITGSVLCSTDANACPVVNGGATIGATFTLCVSASAQALYYRAQDAKDTQSRRLDALVPSGWQIASRSICSAPTISGVDLAGKRATVSCVASAIIQPV